MLSVLAGSQGSNVLSPSANANLGHCSLLPVSLTQPWFPEGNSLPPLPCTDRTTKIMPLSTITSGSVLNRADFSPDEAVLSVSYHEKM